MTKARLFGFIGAVILVALGLPLSTHPASATTMTTKFTLEGVTFADGGTATGWFVLTTNGNDIGGVVQLVSVDITTSAGTQYAGAHYVSTLSWGLSTYVVDGTFYFYPLFIGLPSGLGGILFPFESFSTTQPFPLSFDPRVLTSQPPRETFLSDPQCTASPTCGYRRILSGALNPTVATSTGTSLTSSLNPSLIGQSVVLTATVTPTGAPGSVSFKDGTTTLCSAVVLVNGAAACTTSFLTAGAHQITAVYGGSASYGISTSPILNQTVHDQPARTVETIGRFMSRRNDLILSSEPNRRRQIERLFEAGGNEASRGVGPAVATGQMESGRGGRGPVGMAVGAHDPELAALFIGVNPSTLTGGDGARGAQSIADSTSLQR